MSQSTENIQEGRINSVRFAEYDPQHSVVRSQSLNSKGGKRIPHTCRRRDPKTQVSSQDRELQYLRPRELEQQRKSFSTSKKQTSNQRQRLSVDRNNSNQTKLSDRPSSEEATSDSSTRSKTTYRFSAHDISSIDSLNSQHTQSSSDCSRGSRKKFRHQNLQQGSLSQATRNQVGISAEFLDRRSTDQWDATTKRSLKVGNRNPKLAIASNAPSFSDPIVDRTDSFSDVEWSTEGDFELYASSCPNIRTYQC